MRKLFLHFAVTADGIVSNVEQWVSFTDEAMKDTSAYHDSVDAIIFGKNNYAPLAEYWQKAETSSNSAAERAFAKQINDMHKYVLTHGEVELAWRNTALLRVQDGATFKQAMHGLKQMLEILRLRISKRGIDVACMQVGEPQIALNAARQEVTLKHGVDTDTARKLVKLLKESSLKVQTQIQGEQLRVTGKKKDDLQAAIALLRKSEAGVPLQYVNFRD